MDRVEQQEIVRILDTVLEKESRAKEAAGAVLDQIAMLKKIDSGTGVQRRIVR